VDVSLIELPVSDRLVLDHEDVIDDDELAALAMAADPDQPLDPDAAPFLAWNPDGPTDGSGDLPSWYMAPAVTTTPRRWHRPIAALLVAAFVVIPAFGFCITYGSLMLA
jgi:hypothetical protein